MSKRLNLIGKRFGCLTVESFAGIDKNKTCFIAVCDCGKKVLAIGAELNSGHRTSCGCRLNLTIHGMTGTRFHFIYKGIKDRTIFRPEKYIRYKNIKLCNRWMKFKNFKKDMLDSYILHVKKFGEKNTTIDRIDNSKGYNSKNCRWATIQEQLLNRGNTIYLSDGKKKLTMKEWSKKLKKPYNTLFARYLRNWPEKEVIYGRL